MLLALRAERCASCGPILTATQLIVEAATIQRPAALRSFSTAAKLESFDSQHAVRILTCNSAAYSC